MSGFCLSQEVYGGRLIFFLGRILLCLSCSPFPLFIGQFFDHLSSPMFDFGQSQRVQSCFQNFSAHYANCFFVGHNCNFILITPLPLDRVPPLIFYYHPEHTFVLDRTLFAWAITITPRLFLDGLFGIVYEHFSRCFILEDPSSGFLELFQAIVIIICGDILSSIVMTFLVRECYGSPKKQEF